MMKKRILAMVAALTMVCTSLTPSSPVQAADTATGTTYYVSTVDGNDNNDGKSESQAFYSLDKINEITLQPGDQVLLECGSVFQNGYLHIKGSGTKEAPIVIDQYGSGNKPIIKTNGEGVWYQDYGKSLDSSSHKYQGYVSSSILLYDVEYIEIKNLEITNVGTDIETTYNSLNVMNRTGVAAVAQNGGTLDHIYLDGLYIHDVIGNVYDKHMNNGGIYFTQFVPDNEATTGIAKYDDVRIENCYVDNVNRWGIAVGYTYNWNQFTTAALSDEVVSKYGSTNVVIRNNYVKDAGGDAITVMYCDRPLIEYNVSDGVARQINTTDYSASSSGRVAAAIWPWKCKDAVFQYNEAFDTCSNQDGQAWDADYGDGTIYQYNYSHNNGGGAVMFCGVQAINNIFRYNISYHDLGGVMNPAGNPDAHIYNNTFYVKEGIDFIRTNMAGGGMLLENNIIYYDGATAKEENWNKQEGSYGYTYNNNLYYNYTTTPEEDANAIVEDPLFLNTTTAAPTEYTGADATSGKRITHDLSAFEMFKIQTTSPAVNAGKVIDDNGGYDFYGNAVTDIPDIGAYDTQTVGLSRDNEIKEAVYMVSGQEIFVPSVKNNETSVSEFIANITVAEDASIKVMSGNAEVTDSNIAEGMTLQVTAANGDVNAYTITVKNAYQWALDYAGRQQGNVWYAQEKNNDGTYTNLSVYDGTYPQWVVDTWYGVGVDLPNHTTEATDATHGLLTDTLGSSKKAGLAMAYRVPKDGVITWTVKDDEPYLRQDGNANGTVTLKFTQNGETVTNVDGEQAVYTLETSKVKADVKEIRLEVKKGDFLRVEASNNNSPTKPSVHVTPSITYVSEGQEEVGCQHVWKAVAQKAATCTSEGHSAYNVCENCQETEGYQVLSKIAHTYKVVTKKATTKANGSVVERCACGDVKSTEVITKIGTVKLSKTTYVYTGKKQTIKLVVKDANGKVISKDNYSVKYSSRKSVGKQTVTVTFKNNYEGSKKLTFKIKPKATTLKTVKAGKKAITIKWSKKRTQVTGYQVQYCTNKNFKSGVKNVWVKSAKTTSKTVKKLKAKKTYYVRVRTYKTVGKTKFYSAWSKVKSVKTK